MTVAGIDDLCGENEQSSERIVMDLMFDWITIGFERSGSFCNHSC